MLKIRRASVTLVLLVLGVAAVPLASQADRAPAGRVWVRVATADGGRAVVAGVVAGDTSAAQPLDYGGFYWLALNDAELAALEASGADYQVYPDPYTLQLGGQRFDPVEGVAQLPAEWDRVSSDGPDLHLVQFAGPTRAEWLAALRASGLEFVQYIHPFTYVVWGDTGAADKARTASAVRWVGDMSPAYRVLPQWRSLGGEPVQVSVLLYRGADTGAALGRIEALGGWLSSRAVLNQTFEIAGFALSGTQLQAAAQVPGVYSIQVDPVDGGLRGELGDQVNSDNQDANRLAYPGYRDWLARVGLDGSGVTIASVDAGIQNDHPDLIHRMAPCTGATCGGDAADLHGTHTAGIMAADGSSGVTDAHGFLRGLGVAPGASLVEQLYAPFYTWPNGMLLLMTESVRNGASISGNSWGPAGTPIGYDADTMQVDIGVRDADPDAPGNQPLTYVLSIMNGFGGTSTQGTPDEAKNTLTIGSTKLQEDTGEQIREIDDLSANTAHGPALDGRIIPHMVAPGCAVDSTLPEGYGVSGWCGTSMASPQVSGAVALFVEYYRHQLGADPSPAMVKAAFLPVAHDLAGHVDANGGILGHPFDARQGWGRLDVAAVVDPQVPVLYYDNPVIFDNTGEEWAQTVAAADPDQPVRIMLVWTDAPGHGLGGTTPAWNNDLDLVVEAGGKTYRGNNFAADGWSQPGGVADYRNNTEGVFLGPSVSGRVTIQVVAANIASDGIPNQGDSTDQDLSLVCYNCLLPDFVLTAQPDRSEVCPPDGITGKIQVGQISGFSEDVSLSVLDAPAGVVAHVEPAIVTPPGEANLSLDVGSAAASGEYTLTVAGTTESGIVHTIPLYLAVTMDACPAPALLSPADGSLGLPYEDLPLTWGLVAQADSYRLQVARDPVFAAPLVDVSGIPAGTHVLQTGLEPATCYFWRAAGENSRGLGPWASPFHFATVVPDPLPSTSTPSILSVTPGGGVTSTQTAVTITGASFVPTPVVMLGETPLLDVTRVSSTTLTAEVPASLLPGTYDMTVINPDCQQATLSGAFIAGCSGPQVAFSTDSPVELGQPMHFVATATGTGPLTYAWDFGDSLGTSEGPNATYTYQTARDWEVRLRVDGTCGSATVSDTVIVLDSTWHVYMPLVGKGVTGH